MAKKEGRIATPLSSDYLYFELEKSRMERERSILVLNKAFIFYFAYMVVGVLGFINRLVDQFTLNVLVLLGLTVLVVGTIPFVKTMRKEEENINSIMERLKKG